MNTEKNLIISQRSISRRYTVANNCAYTCSDDVMTNGPLQVLWTHIPVGLIYNTEVAEKFCSTCLSIS